jgi:2-polyprenyl-6-hydroxyphenyl methylase / 3-demethylubiquinone-9 3-methyltransferase
MTQTPNADQAEVDKFSQLASRWWDPGSEFKPLHEINPLRLGWIEAKAGLKGKAVLDVGCGGGILAEAMAETGGMVKGIDLSDKALKVAALHLLESGAQVDYELVSAEALAERQPASFDVITCMELLEHVPDPASTVAACSRLLKPGGHAFFSTINRNAKAYLFAVVGAEYLLKLLPKGTHDYTRFLRPSELAGACRASGLDVDEIIGMTYNPLSKQYSLSADCDVNYIVHCLKEA